MTKPTQQCLDTLRIWQWNCRGYKHKQGTLQQYITSIDQPPDIITLQETNALARLPGYTTHTTHEGRDVCTLIRKDIVAIQHTLPASEHDHIFTELIPPKTSKGHNCFILNIYCRPKNRHSKLATLLHQATKKAGASRLLIAGDFNAAHPAWGYPYYNKRGKELMECIDNETLTLLIDPAKPTRVGNSVSRDTCPDLTLAKNAPHTSWMNLEENFSSDHMLVQTEIQGTTYRRQLGEARITDWQTLRKNRETAPDDPIMNIELWVKELSRDVQRHTRTLQTTTQIPAIDNYLLHLWEARRSLTKRWRKQKLNRKLKLRITKLAAEADVYAAVLCRQNWLGQCDDLRGTLSLTKTWNLLRYLIDPMQSRGETNKTLKRILHQYPGTTEDLFKVLQAKYIASTQPLQPTPYTGPHNSPLDQPFIEAEFRAALTKIRKNTSPGMDQITNSALANLDDKSVTLLTAYMNQCWEKGSIPPAWKAAEIRLIPKPGKEPSIENLRPISLTSCVGKLMEHMVLNRLQNYLEDSQLMPHTMFGFRPHLSTQDILLQLREDILSQASKHTPKAILALDLKGAFDNVNHETILQNLNNLGCGERMYSYIRDFLTDRTAVIKIEDKRSQPINIGSKGTPQGAVLSPLLFNIALINLPKELNQIPGLHHGLYADDITIWIREGSEGEMQDKLQQATDIVRTYAESCGLKCAPQKSELLLVRKRSHLKNTAASIEIELDGVCIRPSPSIKVLGMTLQEDCSNNQMVRKLDTTVGQITHMIRRITNKKHGMKEQDTLRLVQAFVISRITYATPYATLKSCEHKKLDVLIRKSYKQALGLPPNTSNEKLLALGLHNTLDELIEAHLTSQQQRLAITQTGRKLLHHLGYPPRQPETSTEDIPKEIRSNMEVAPIPRNMHPEHHEGRRTARVRWLEKIYGQNDETVYTDAADYAQGPAMTAVVTNSSKILTSLTLRQATTLHAEEVAIALAVAQTPATTIITDSQSACRTYANGRISRTALKILLQAPPTRTVTIVWTPAHSTLRGNLAAHASARELAGRAPQEDQKWVSQPLVTFRDITQHYKLSRLTYPPSHKSTTKEQETMLRQLQTNTFPHPTRLHAIFPNLHKPNCPHCNEPSTLYHMIWACQRNKDITAIPHPTIEQWEEELCSSDPDRQLRLIERARTAARSIGVLD